MTVSVSPNPDRLAEYADDRLLGITRLYRIEPLPGKATGRNHAPIPGIETYDECREKQERHHAGEGKAKPKA